MTDQTAASQATPEGTGTEAAGTEATGTEARITQRGLWFDELEEGVVYEHPPAAR